MQRKDSRRAPSLYRIQEQPSFLLFGGWTSGLAKNSLDSVLALRVAKVGWLGERGGGKNSRVRFSIPSHNKHNNRRHQQHRMHRHIPALKIDTI